MKAKILAGWLLEHPDLEVLVNAVDHRDQFNSVKPLFSTALYSDIVDSEHKIIVKQDEDFILIEGIEL